MPPAQEQMLRMYRQMLTIRSFETHAADLWKADLITGSLHSYMGEEAIAVGVCAALRPTDYIVSTHRGHGHCIAKGGDVRRMMAELMGRRGGYCEGKGGSKHIADVQIGMLGASGIVGGGLPMAVGAGLSAKMRGTGQVTVGFFGDGASNEGSCHESMNLAAVWKVPTIFVCENNQYAQTTNIARAMSIENVADRAAGYGMPGEVVDGMDPVAVYDAIERAAARARQGDGPSLIECKSYRFQGHMVGEDTTYRPKEEVASWLARDPIPRFESRLIEVGMLTPERSRQMEAEVELELQYAIEFSKASPAPPPESLFEGLYA